MNVLAQVKHVTEILSAVFVLPSTADHHGLMLPTSALRLVQMVTKVFVVKARNALHGPVVPILRVSTVDTASITRAQNVKSLASLGLRMTVPMTWHAGHTQLVMPRRKVLTKTGPFL